MARSTFAVPYIDPIYNITYQVNGIVSNRGFEEFDYDGEKVWSRENKEYNTIDFVKFDFETDVFIYSVWIKVKDDTDSYREYNLNHFERDSKETEILTDIVGTIYKCFGGSLKQKKVYVFENKNF